MMLRQHALVSLALVFPFIFQSPGLIVAALFVILGSLLPDMDIAEAPNGKKPAVNTLMFLLGKAFNYPISLLFSVLYGKDVTGHRGFSHTLVAGALVSALAFAVLSAAGMAAWYSVFLFIGYAMHLLEDAMTPGGVSPFLPLPLRLRGRIKTDNAAWDIIAIIIALPSVALMAGAISQSQAIIMVALSVLALCSTVRIGD
jgi:membrane-bound metal-dependent hydrolase YbcI (DUF457 family)